MKYRTENELAHFEIKDVHITEMKQMLGYFYAVLDNVVILPDNSCNRDIRKMRANGMELKIPDGQVKSLVKEGYKMYDADGRLKKELPDEPVDMALWQETFESFAEATLYSVEKEKDGYAFVVDTEEATYAIQVTGEKDSEEWDRFLNLE